MKTAVLFSGGKDSTRTVDWCLENGYDVKYLVSIISKRKDSWMYHTPNIHLTELSSQAMEIPLVTKESSGVKEEEVKDMEEALRLLDIEYVACGGIASNYQKSRIEKVCNKLGLKLLIDFHYSDFWADPEKQIKPKKWCNYTFNKLVSTVYEYTKDVILAFKNLNIVPDIIQVGNEIDNGFLWDDGKIDGTSLQWNKFCDLIKTNNFHMEFQNKNIVLTRREYDVLFWLAQGKAAKEVAVLLEISSRTVETHLKNIKEKSQCFCKSRLIDMFRNNLLNIVG